MAETVQRWDLVVPTPDDGQARHRVATRDSGFSRIITWSVNDAVVVEKKSAEDTLVITDETHGSLRLLFTGLGRPKRVTWFEPGAAVSAHVGVGGIDLDPEPGSKAALREAKVRAHPRRYAARHVAAGIAKVVVPILLATIAIRFAVQIPWPDWNLPSIPWPDISIPWPQINLPAVSLPGWLLWVLDKMKYVVPILIGVVLARNEIKRRQKQDRLKEELRAARES